MNYRCHFQLVSVWILSEVIDGRGSGCRDDNQHHLEMLAMILRYLWPVG
jgi:hypothetical protein